MSAVADLYFMREPELDTLWVGGRGSGKTLDFAIVEHLLMAHFADTVVNVGAVEEQAQACYRYVQAFDAMPHFKRNLRRSIISRTEYLNGANLKIIPATPAQCNGPHTRVVCWDEFDLTNPVAYAEGQSIPITLNGRPPQTIMTSSLKFPFGNVVTMMRAAAKGTKAINVKRWCVVADTMVSCEDGERRIDTIRPGDNVWSYTGTGFDLVRVAHAGKTAESADVVRVNFTDGTSLVCTPDHEIRTLDGWTPAGSLQGGQAVLGEPMVRLWDSGFVPMVGRNPSVGVAGARLLRVASVESAGQAAVYDLEVPGTHNFVANGVVVHNCVYEIVQNCPPTRHKDGAGCRGTGVPRPGQQFPDDACPLAADCLYKGVDDEGFEGYLDGPGKAAKSQGFMPLDDVIKKYRTLDEDTWKSQWRSERPSVKGLIYPQFTAKNIIPRGEFQWNPMLPVYAGVDFGFTNATAMVFVQMTADGKLVAFAEWIKDGFTSPETARIFKSLPWGQAAMKPGSWVRGDPAAADARAVWSQNGIPILAADNSLMPSRSTPDDDSGIAKLRWCFSPMGIQDPLLYICEECDVLIEQLQVYHVKDVPEDRNEAEAPQKVNDHGPDALRYVINGLIRRRTDKNTQAA
jgi:hypothetical protein